MSATGCWTYGIKSPLSYRKAPSQKTSLVFKASWAPKNEGVTGGGAAEP